MRYFEVSGSNFECGESIGRRLSREIRRRVKAFSIPEKSATFQDVLQKVDAVCAREYPLYVEELKGYSKGAGVPYMHMLLLNCPEIIDGHGCSSFADFESSLLFHNEDGDTWEKKKDFSIVKQRTGKGYFFSFLYPGELPGSAFSWNSNGLVFAISNLVPLKKDLGKAPKTFSARRIVESADIDEAVGYLEDNRCASGYHFMIMKGREIVSVEQSPECISVQKVSGRYAHTNHYLHQDLCHMSNPSQGSLARLRRIEELVGKKTLPLRIMFDKKNRPLSLYNRRNDANKTLATFVAKPLENKVLVYERDSEKSVTVFPITE